jgi:hypothetical protein
MKKLLLLVWILFSGGLNWANAQTAATYQADLAQLYQILQKLPSFQDQITGKKREAYQNLVAKLRQDTTQIQSKFNQFCQLAQLFFPLNDNHLAFSQVEFNLSLEQLKDADLVNKYRNSKAFLQFPTLALNLDSLQTALLASPSDSIAGIYQYEQYLKVGLFKKANTQEYWGVVLASELPHWDKGQVAIRLCEYMPNHFKAIYAHPIFKVFQLEPNEKWRKGALLNSYFYATGSQSTYQKATQSIDYARFSRDEPEFQFRTLSPKVQYMHIGTFMANPRQSAASKAFINTYRDSLRAAHLILDLRNNRGGADKEAKKFTELLKKYAQTGKIWVIVNNETISQGELFLLFLKKLPSVKVLGEATQGMLAYGSNYGRQTRLPSDNFQVYTTDMRNGSKALTYETVGVQPDIYLNNQRNWLDQVLDLINQ